jgi:RNA polymerase sigma factor (sigma-70 family)
MSPNTERRQWVLAALDQFEGRLLRYAQRLLGNLDEARDVVQFVFLRLCDQSPETLGDRLAQWLYTVCRNRALDVLRGRGGVARAPTRSVGRCEANQGAPPSRENDPADSAEQAELHALLRVLVEELPASQREALDLWADGFGYLEISRIIDRQEGHVRVLVHRGLKALREHPQVKALLSDDSAAQRPTKRHPKTNRMSPVGRHHGSPTHVNQCRPFGANAPFSFPFSVG